MVTLSEYRARLERVRRVESAHVVPLPNRQIIRVEAHLVLASWPGVSSAPMRIMSRGIPWFGAGTRPAEPWKGHEICTDGEWQDYHARGQVGEWDAYDVASNMIGVNGALCATSWGAYQILGRYWRAMGYASAADFLAAPDNDRLDRALRTSHIGAADALQLEGDQWAAAFARVWNGPGQVDYYAKKLLET